MKLDISDKEVLRAISHPLNLKKKILNIYSLLHYLILQVNQGYVRIKILKKNFMKCLFFIRKIIM